MPRFVHLTFPRKAAKEIVDFLGAFAFSELGNTLITQGIGVQPPKALENFLAGASTPLNTTINNYLRHFILNENEVAEKLFLEKANEAGIAHEDAMKLYKGQWPKTVALVAKQGEEGYFLDAAGLAKKIDCTAKEAAFMLGLSSDSPFFRFALAVNESNIIGIALAGTITYFKGPVPFDNPLVSRLLTAVCAQVGTRITQETANQFIRKIGLYAGSTAQVKEKEETQNLLIPSAPSSPTLENPESAPVAASTAEEEIVEDIPITPRKEC